MKDWYLLNKLANSVIDKDGGVLITAQGKSKNMTRTKIKKKNRRHIELEWAGKKWAKRKELVGRVFWYVVHDLSSEIELSAIYSILIEANFLYIIPPQPAFQSIYSSL